MRRPPVIAVSGGDPAGIGPRVALAASIEAARKMRCIPVLFTHDSVLSAKTAPQRTEKLAKVRGSIEEVLEERRPAGTVWIVHVGAGRTASFKAGRPTIEGADVAMRSLHAAAECTASGRAAALVTGPVSKEWMSRLEPFEGHTEWLAAFSGTPKEDIVMFFAGKRVKISTVTRHLPLSQVPKRLDRALITGTIVMTCASLILDFRMKNARVGVAGLNPHASDGGLLGREEEEVIEPAIRSSKKLLERMGWKKRITLEGPLGADGLLRLHALGSRDAVVTMYHDQAMIAAKVMEPHSCAGYTLGLPFIRTTPDHGTAFDAAAGGNARPEGMRSALELAVRLSSMKNGLRGHLGEIRRALARAGRG